ncbi:MAG: hypothetical protein RRY35_05055 [Clostridiales bacterium]
MIKKTEGTTLITIFKGGLIAVALCSSFSMHAFAENTFTFMRGGFASIISMIKTGDTEVVYTDMENAQLTILYYTEPNQNGIATSNIILPATQIS